MIDDNGIPVESTRAENSAPSTNNDDQVRWFLVRATVTLMFLALVAYLLTRDLAVLGTTTLIGVAVIAVFRYYFTLNRKQ